MTTASFSQVRADSAPEPRLLQSLRRPLLDYLLLLVGLALAGLAVWQLRQPVSPSLEGILPWWLLAVAGLVGGLGLYRMEAWLPDAQPLPVVTSFPGVRRRLLGCLAVLAAAVITIWIVLQLWPNVHGNWPITLLPWLASLLLILLGGWLLRALGQPGSQEKVATEQNVSGIARQRGVFPRWLEITLFFSILALAIFLRLYRLDEIPPAIFVDETNAATEALAILEGRPVSPFTTGWYETPNGFIYYMAGIFKALGANYVTLKLVSLIPAIFTVPAVYLLARLLFGATAALFTMFLFAVSRWHLTMSRWAWNEVAPPLFFALSACFLIQGLRERRAFSYVCGGLLGGLMIYTYLSSRLAVLTLILFTLGWLATDPDGPMASWRRSWRGLVFYLLAALVAVAPLCVTYITHPFTFFNRSSEINIFREIEAAGSSAPLRQNIWNHVQLFYQKGDPNGRHNLPGEPQSDPVTGVLLVVGLGYALLRFRDRRRMLLLIWLIINLAGGYLSELHTTSPNSYRALNALVAVVILAGDSLDRMARGLYWILQPARSLNLNSRIGQLRAGLALALLPTLLLAGYAAYWEISTYFGAQAESVAVQSSFSYTETRVAHEVTTAIEEGTAVYLSPRFYHFSPLRFLVYGAIRDQVESNPLERPPFSLARPEVDLPLPATGGDALLLLDNYYAAVLDYVRYFYPNAEIEQIYGPGGAAIFIQVKIRQAELQSLQGLTLITTSSDGATTSRRVATFAPVEESGSRRFEWRGSLRLDQSGYYNFMVENAVLEINGAPWNSPRYLGRGFHTIHLVQEKPVDLPVTLDWQTPAGPIEAVSEAALFTVQPPGQGLTGFYYPNESWSGQPVMQQVTPFLLLSWPPGEPLPHPFSATFAGFLRVETPGFYSFRIEADDGVRLTLGNQVLGESLIPDQPNQVYARVELTSGLHEIRIDYFQRGGGNALEFFWRPPNGLESPVPPSVLAPME
jgi:hypothetical protein